MQPFLFVLSLMPWMVMSVPVPQLLPGRAANPALAAVNPGMANLNPNLNSVNPALAALNPALPGNAAGGMPNMMKNLNNMLSNNLNRMNEVSASFARGKQFPFGKGNAPAFSGIDNLHRQRMSMRNGETVNAANEPVTPTTAISAAVPPMAPVKNQVQTQVQAAPVASQVINTVPAASVTLETPASATISTPLPDPILPPEPATFPVVSATPEPSAVPKTTDLPQDLSSDIPTDPSLTPSKVSSAEPVVAETLTSMTSMDDPSLPKGSELKSQSSSPFLSSSYGSINVSHATCLYPKVIFLVINVFMSFCLVVIFY